MREIEKKIRRHVKTEIASNIDGVSQVALEEIHIVLTALSVFLVAIQAYLVYRIDKAKLALETYVGITEKSELRIDPETRNGQSEIIRLTNTGLIPIDELEAEIDITVSRKKQQDLSFHLEWQRKTILSSKEVAVIPLYEKLTDFLIDKKLITIREEAFPGTDPETGEDITDTLPVPDLVKPFSAILAIEVKSKIQRQLKTTKKKFRLNYIFRYEPLPYYEPDYEITIHEHVGEWKE